MTAETGERKTRILVIEDNPSDVDLLRRALRNEQLDFELTVIEDGADALEFVKSAATATPLPDLAIIDLNLPKHDGIEILTEMRANRLFADLPVMVISSSSSPRDRARLEQFHIRRFVTKPPELDEYLKIGSTVKELLFDPSL